MKKTLIALAVLGAFGAAHASDVTIYGKLQPSYDFVDVDATNDISDMTWNNSRLGFKGSEDLGNGLKAIFQIESKVKMTETGGGSIADRDSWVGLAGEFGSITFGNHQTAYVKAAAKYDFMSDSIGDYNNIMGAVSGAASGDNSDELNLYLNARVKKSAYYKSPVISGFQVQASYAMGAQHKLGDDQDISAIAATYTNGPLQVLAGYEVQKNGALSGKDVEGMKIGAGYKLPFGTQINAIYENVSVEDNGGDVDHFYLAAAHPVTSAVDVMASFIYADNDGDVAGSDDGAKMYAVGAKYKFSKRTNVMAVYAKIANDSTGQYGIDSNGYYAAQGKDVSAFSVRLQHNF